MVSAKLQLYSAVHGWSDYRTPIRQHAAVIDCSSGTALSALDWATYISEKDADKVALETLGRYDLPAADGDLLATERLRGQRRQQRRRGIDSGGSRRRRQVLLGINRRRERRLWPILGRSSLFR